MTVTNVIDFSENFDLLKYREMTPSEFIVLMRGIKADVEIFSKSDLVPAAKVTNNKITLKTNYGLLSDKIVELLPNIDQLFHTIYYNKSLNELYPVFLAKPIYTGSILGSLEVIGSLLGSKKYDLDEYFGLRIATLTPKVTFPQEIILISKANIIYFLMTLLNEKSFEDSLILYKDFNEDKVAWIISELIMADNTGEVTKFIKELPNGNFNANREVIDRLVELMVDDS